MSKLTDKISYLQGLAEGMKLKPEKDSHRLLLGILDVLGDVGLTADALAEHQKEILDQVNYLDGQIADLEDEVFVDDYVRDDADAAEDGDDGDETEEGVPGPEGLVLYECPHCHTTVEIDPDSEDLDEKSLCPACGKELFPEALEDGEE